jgi:hypothetical protein
VGEKLPSDSSENLLLVIGNFAEGQYLAIALQVKAISSDCCRCRYAHGLEGEVASGAATDGSQQMLFNPLFP